MLLHTSLTLLSLAIAAVQLDFEISNSHDVQKSIAKTARLGQLGHKVLRRDAKVSSDSGQNRTSSQEGGNSSFVEPLINASLTTSYNFYHGQLLVGSPAQELDVLLDTGSPVSWVYGPQGSFNNASMFFPNKSSSFENGNETFSAEYGSGEYLGHWGTDLVSAAQFVAGNTTHNTTNASYAVPFEFGVVSSFATAAGAPGLLGLGPHIKNAGPSSYVSLPEAYKKNNITSSSAFSIFLEQKTGRFLFGGVDLAFAQLPLYRFPPHKSLSGSVDGGSPTSWMVLLETLRLNNNDDYLVRGQTTLDTGSPVSLLPPGFVDQVGKQLNLTSYGRYETYYINGTMPEAIKNATITFTIGKFSVKIAAPDLFIPGELIWLDDGPQNVTALSFMGSHNYLLGDSFFRHVYSVLDPATGDVMLARRTAASSNATLNGTSTKNATNASSVVPFAKLAQNSSAIVNGSLSTSSSNQNSSLVTSADMPGGTDAPMLQNRYMGTVPADKQASMTASADSSSTQQPSASQSSSASSATSQSKSSNAAPVLARAPISAGFIAFLITLV